MLLRFTALFVFISLLTSSQILANPKKLSKDYKKKNYEKVLKRCNKLLNKGQSEQYIWYYKTAAHLKLAAKEKSLDPASSIYLSCESFEVYESLGQDQKRNYLLKSLTKDIKRKLRINEKDSSELRKGYLIFLAEFTKDTLEEYFIYFPIRTIDESPIISNTGFNRDQITFKIPDIIPDGYEIIKHSETTLRTPWEMGGMSPGKGFDCSGFVIWSYGKCGYELPHKTTLLAKIGRPVTIDEAKVGDIVCFGSKEYRPERVGHVGMVHSIEDDKVNLIHCGVSTGVIVAPLTEGYWSEREYFIVRIEKEI